MRIIRSLIVALSLLGPLCLPPAEGSWAQVARPALTQEQIAEYAAKLNQAKAIEDRFVGIVGCIEARDREMTAQSNELERQLGTLMTRQEKLASENETRKEELSGFQVAYRKEKATYDQLRRKLERLQAEQRGQKHALQQCKKQWSPFEFLCDAADALARLFGQIRSVEGDIATAKARLRIADQGLRDAERRYRDSHNAYQEVSREYASVSARVGETEQQIKQMKKVLSEIRAEVQPYRLLIGEFSVALEEARSFDTDDGRARTARRVARISEDIGQITVRSGQTLDRAKSVLPPAGQVCVTQ